MARPIGWGVYELLLNGREIEPVFIVSVDWGGSGTKRWYSSKLVLSSEAAHVDPRILSISAFDSALTISLGESRNEVNIKFDDSDGRLKGFFDRYDLHTKPIEIFQWFEGTEYPRDRFSIFQGVINTPVVWSESDRTLTLTGMTRLQDREVGFAFEQAAIDYETDDTYELFGRNIPECFGTVVFGGQGGEDGSAVQIDNENKSNNTGTLQNSIVLSDFTIPYQTEALEGVISYLGYVQAGYAFQASYLKSIGATEQGEEAARLAAHAAGTAGYYQDQIRDHETTYNAQRREEAASRQVAIIGGENFPQGDITLNIGGYNMDGYFDGKYFKHNWRHPDKNEYIQDSIDYPGQTTEALTKRYPAPDRIGMSSGLDASYTGNVSGDLIGSVGVRSGSRVVLASAEPIQHAVSTTPGSVARVAAHAVTPTGVKTKYPEDVPQDLWRQKALNFGKTALTIVETVDSLSKPGAVVNNDGNQVSTPGFQNKVFVDYVSTIGPNPVDIMAYLIMKYTRYGIDRETFARTRMLLQNYGMNFCVPKSKNILVLLREIAFQARCAIYLKDNKFYLHFLPEVPLHNFEFSEENVDVGSIRVDYTDTESIITKWTGKYWPVRGENVDPWACVLRYNIPKYGTQEEETNFYCYNDYHIIQKVMTYWMIRRGHVWKVLRFKGTLDTLAAEVFDGAYLNFKEPYVANEPIIGVITEANYNPQDFTVDYEVWTGVKAGEMEQNAFAYPAHISSSLVFPEVKEKKTAGGFKDAEVDDTSQDVPAPKEKPTYEKEEPTVRLRSGGATSYTVSFPANSPFTPGQGPFGLPEGTFTRGPWEQGNSNDQPHGTPSDDGDGSGRNEPNPGQSGEGGRPADDGGGTKTNKPEHMNKNEKAVKGYIDLHNTNVVDTQSNDRAPFVTFFKKIINNRLQGYTKAIWSDGGENEAEFHFKFDEEGGRFGSGANFMKEN